MFMAIAMVSVEALEYHASEPAAPNDHHGFSNGIDLATLQLGK
jgi:hypothetical protein